MILIQPRFFPLCHRGRILSCWTPQKIYLLTPNWRDADLHGLLEDIQAHGGEDGVPGEDHTIDNEPSARPSTAGNTPSFETSMEEELEQSGAAVARVLVFTTVRMLGFLTMCVRGSVDHNFSVDNMYDL